MTQPRPVTTEEVHMTAMPEVAGLFEAHLTVKRP